MAQARELFQGPGPPWCIGSVVATPHLTTGPCANPIGPLLFDRVDEPRKFLAMGCRLKCLDDPFIRPDRQSRNLFIDDLAPDCPTELAESMFQEDFAHKFTMVHESNLIFGNRLDCLKCSDGSIQLLFPIAENVNSIGSILCSQDEVGRWTPLKKQPDEDDSSWLNGVRLASTSSLKQPIYQIASLGTAIDQALVAARTLYQVHIIKTSKEGSMVSFGNERSTVYKKAVSHLTWNPHLGEELAITLETGDVCVYDVESEGFNIRSLRNPSFTLNDPLRCVSDQSRVKNESSYMGAVQTHFEKQKATWRRTEYGWHPRTLLTANADAITLVDMRSNSRELLPVALATSAKDFCRHRSTHPGRFGALARSDEDQYHFSAATKEHLLLFDVRRPKIPVLQWEHKMHRDAPGFLSMLPLSALRHEENARSSGGRVILATSYRSGDMRAFCYGPNPLTAIVSSASSKLRDVEESYSAWELPSKVFSAFADSENQDPFPAYITLLKSSRNDLWDLKGLERLSGVAVVPHAGPSKNFDIIQLSGTGDIWAQEYRAVKRLENTIPKSINMEPSGIKAKQKKGLGKCRTFPAVLNYTRYGFVWPQEEAEGSKLRQKKPRTEDTKYVDLVHEALAEVDSPLSIFEVAFKVLQNGLDEGLKDSVAGMPADVRGHLQNITRPPYILPPRKIYQEEYQRPRLPMPFLLEAQGKLNEAAESAREFRSDGQRSGHAQFGDACDLVEQAVSGLEKMQMEPVISLMDSQNETQELAFRLHFHSKDRGDGAAGASRFQKFVGCRDGDTIKLQFKLEDEAERYQESEIFAGLRGKLDEWQANFKL